MFARPALDRTLVAHHLSVVHPVHHLRMRVSHLHAACSRGRRDDCHGSVGTADLYHTGLYDARIVG